MDQRPDQDERTLEALEVRRAGCDDPNDPVMESLAAQLAANPELAKIAQQLAKTDAAIGEAFRDVPTPEGLQQRLLDRLAEAERPLAATATRRKSRRWLLFAGSTTVVAAGLLVAALLGLFSPEELTRSEVLASAMDFFNSETPTGKGNPLDLPARYELSTFVKQVPETKWRKVTGFLGRSGIAYDLGESATLYVVRRDVPAIRNTAPPGIPMSSTGGFCVSAWKEGGLLYVLVVIGGRESYRSLLNLPTGPLT